MYGDRFRNGRAVGSADCEGARMRQAVPRDDGPGSNMGHSGPWVVLTLFGTRPEVIKLAPVVAALRAYDGRLRAVLVSSGQHRDLVAPFLRHFGLRTDHDLRAMRPGQSTARCLARILESLDPLLARERPDLILVQGDTTTAMAGALAAFHRGVAVGHVE